MASPALVVLTALALVVVAFVALLDVQGPLVPPQLLLQARPLLNGAPHVLLSGLSYVSGPLSLGPAAAHVDMGEPDAVAYLHERELRGRDPSFALETPASRPSQGGKTVFEDFWAPPRKLAAREQQYFEKAYTAFDSGRGHLYNAWREAAAASHIAGLPPLQTIRPAARSSSAVGSSTARNQAQTRWGAAAVSEQHQQRVFLGSLPFTRWSLNGQALQ